MVGLVVDAHRVFEQHRSELAGLVAKRIYSGVRDSEAVEDVLAEIHVLVLERAHVLLDARERGCVRAWLCGMAFNVGRDAGRRRWRVRCVEEEAANEVVVPVATPEEVCDVEETRDRCRDLLDILDEVDRSIVYRYHDDESFGAIAESLGWERERVRARYYRARRRLQEAAANLDLAA